MSTASKVTLGFSIAFTVFVTGGVFYLQQIERDSLRQGPIKDRRRVEEKNFNKKQMANLNEFELQKKLKAEFEGSQSLTGEIVHGEDKK